MRQLLTSFDTLLLKQRGMTIPTSVNISDLGKLCMKAFDGEDIYGPITWWVWEGFAPGSVGEEDTIMNAGVQPRDGAALGERLCCPKEHVWNACLPRCAVWGTHGMKWKLWSFPTAIVSVRLGGPSPPPGVLGWRAGQVRGRLNCEALAVREEVVENLL